MLLLDEMLPPTLAERLSRAGCDTIAIAADPGLRGSADARVLEIAQVQGRVLVTENIRDFVPLSRQWTASGLTHEGILLVSTKTFPLTKDRIGRLASALLARHAASRWPGRGQYDFL